MMEVYLVLLRRSRIFKIGIDGFLGVQVVRLLDILTFKVKKHKMFPESTRPSGS